jgi:hypothetical protein
MVDAGRHAAGDIARTQTQCPGFPQDAYMEGPAMAMDSMVEKPENYGFAPAGAAS